MTQEEQDRLVEKRKRYEAKLKLAVRELSKSRHFEVLIWEILSYCEIFNAGHFDTDLIQFMNGKRSAGVFVVDLLDKADKQLFPKILLNRRSTDD